MCIRDRLKGVRRARAGSNRSHGIFGPPIAEVVRIADRLAMMPGDCETRDSAGQQRKSAIQQKDKLPEIITETRIFKGNAERPPHSRSGIGLNCGLIQSIIPVSYTHLDVYKRQISYRVAARSGSGAEAATLTSRSARSIPATRSVSYTHLDVYKRQV